MDSGPLPHGTGQGKGFQHQAEGFVVFVSGSEGCLSFSSHPACRACPQLHRLPEHLGLTSGGALGCLLLALAQSRWPSHPEKATPCCHTPCPHHGTGDTCPGERVQGLNTKLKPTFLSPKKFPVASISLFAPTLLQFSVFSVQLINDSIH